jgi:hypothetical protein
LQEGERHAMLTKNSSLRKRSIKTNHGSFTTA